MKKKKTVRPLVGVVCVLALILVVELAVVLDGLSPNPILGIFRPDPTEEQGDIPELGDFTEATFDVPDTEPGEETTTPETQPGLDLGIDLPAPVGEHGLVIEKLAPYTGLFVEDGSNSSIENVAMMLVQNKGSRPVEFAQIKVEFGEETLEFDISALPVGAKLVVQEKSGKAIPTESKVTDTSAMVVQRTNMEMSKNKIRVTDIGDNTLKVTNLSDEVIPTVRVFYKYYMEEEGIYVGGIAFTVRITRLAPGASVTVQPSHYNTKTSRVVMALTYDSEV